MPVKFLLFWPQGSRHQNVLHRWLGYSDNLLNFLSVRQDSDWVKLGSSSAFGLLIDSSPLVRQQDGWLVHQTEWLLLSTLLYHALNFVIRVLLAED